MTCKMNPGFHVLLLFLFLVLTSAESNKPLTEQFQEDAISPGGSFSFYNFYEFNPTRTKEQRFYYVIVFPLNEVSDPDVFVSFDNRYPTMGDFDFSCDDFGEDICVVPQDAFQGETVFVGVFCPGDCSYRIKYGQSTSHVIGMNDVMVLNLTKDDSTQWVDLNMDYDLSFTKISIHARIQNYFEFSEGIKLYVKQFVIGEEDMISTGNYDLLGKPSWLFGESVLISKAGTNEFFCHDRKCDYQIMVTGPEGGIVELSVKVTGDLEPINDEERVFDIVSQNGVNCYKMSFSEEEVSSKKLKEKTLILELVPYAGSPSLYLQLDSQPFDIFDTGDYRYKVTNTNFQRMMITPKQRTGSKNQEFYMAVASNTESSYSIKASFDTSNDFYIEPSLPYSGFVGFDQVVNYHTKVPLVGSDPFVEISLLTTSGNADLFVLVCDLAFFNDTETICEVTLDVIRTPTELQNAGLYFYSNNTGLLFDYVHISLNSTHCHTGCSLVIGVLGNDRDQGESAFTLFVSVPQSATLIREDQIVRGAISQGVSNHYKFTVLDQDQTLLNLKVQLHVIAGKTNIFVSMRDPNPAEVPGEISYWSLFEKGGTLDLGNRAGDYLIEVSGVTSCVFDLLVKFERNETADPLKGAIEIIEGQPWLGKITRSSQKDSYAFYYNITGIDKYDQKKAIVALTPVSGEYVLEVFNENNHLLNSTKHLPYILTVSSEDKTGYFFISVCPRIDSVDDDVSYEYYIGFTVGGYPEVLLDSTPGVAYLPSQKVKYYQFFYDRHDTKITIELDDGETGENDMSSLEMFVSFDESNPLPSQKKNNLRSETGRIVLDSSRETWQNCDKALDQEGNEVQGGRIGVCVIYLAIYNPTSSEKIVYLLAYKEAESIQLIQGVEEVIRLSSFSGFKDSIDYVFESFVGLNKAGGGSQQIRLSVHTNLCPFDVSTTVLNGYDRDSARPGPESSQINDVVLLMDQELFDFCFPECRMSIRVTVYDIYRDDDEEFDQNSYFDEVYVLLHSQPDMIWLGSLIKDFVMEGHLNTYIFMVDSKAKFLAINALPMDSGSIQVYASSQFENLSELQKEKNTIIPEEGKEGFIQVDLSKIGGASELWGLSVSGKSNCSYILTVTASEVGRLQNIFLGEIQEIPVSMGEMVYFQLFYDVISEEDFSPVEIHFATTDGNATLFVNTFDPETAFLGIQDYFPKEEWANVTWKAKAIGSFGGRLTIDPSDPNYCFECYYLIGVMSTAPSDLTIFIRDSETSVDLLVGSPFFDSILVEEGHFSWVKNEYNVSVIATETYYIEVSLYIYEGEPVLGISREEDQSFQHFEPEGDFIKIGISDDFMELVDDDRFLRERTLQMEVPDDVARSIAIEIEVKCLDSCQYSLLVLENKVRSVRLSPGTSFHDNLERDESKNYTVEYFAKESTSSHQSSNRTLKFFVSSTEKASSGLSSFSVEILQYSEQNSSYVSLENWREIDHFLSTDKDEFGAKIIEPKPGKYIFTVEARENVELDILVLFDEDFELVSMNHEFQNEVSLSSSQIYQVLSPSSGTLVVHAYQCIGEVTVDISTDYFKFDTNRQSAISSNIGVSLVEERLSFNQKESLYIKVAPKEFSNATLQHGGSVYRLMLYMVEGKQEVPFDFIQPGGNREVKTKEGEKGQKVVEFQPLTIFNAETGKMELFNQSYLFVVSAAETQAASQYFSSCSGDSLLQGTLGRVVTKEVQVFPERLKECCSVEMEGLEDLENVFVSVSAFVKRAEFGTSLPMKIDYFGQMHKSQRERDLKVVVFGLLVILVLLGIVLVRQWRKVTSLQKSIMEMSEVSQNTNAEEQPRPKGPKYRTFLEDDNKLE